MCACVCACTLALHIDYTKTIEFVLNETKLFLSSSAFYNFLRLCLLYFHTVLSSRSYIFNMRLKTFFNSIRFMFFSRYLTAMLLISSTTGKNMPVCDILYSYTMLCAAPYIFAFLCERFLSGVLVLSFACHQRMPQQTNEMNATPMYSITIIIIITMHATARHRRPGSPTKAHLPL